MTRPIRCPAPAGVRLYRDDFGVPHVESKSDDLGSVMWGMGWCHAMDRGLQMLLMRILGQGRASECLDASDEMLEVDRFFRRMSWHSKRAEQVEALGERTAELAQRYCDGVNERFAKKRPWELKLVGYRPEPWTVEDVVLISRMIGYLTLAQSQAEMERLIVEMIQAGVPDDKLQALFPGCSEIAHGLDRELLGRVRLTERIVPESLKWLSPAPRMMASNNWAVSGDRTASGGAVLANDPHLEVNRLPNVWCELVFKWGKELEHYVMCATMPGLPGPLVARNRDVAWGATYTFMDANDSWIEDCKDGKCRRGDDEWIPFDVRREVIRRKKKPPVEVTFYENEHGTLDGDPNEAGLYLATRWAPATSGARSLEAIASMWEVRSVEEGMTHLGAIETTWSWVLADREGNIGFQMSGLCPLRREGASGMVPLPGWLAENDWQGFAEIEDLPRCLNPDEGFVVTANNDLNQLGRVGPINLPMGDYRARRIAELLSTTEKLTPEDFKRIHLDDTSIQAAEFLEVLGPLLPDDEAGRLLRSWDCRYTTDSTAATLFERFYRELHRRVFGAEGFGEPVIEYLLDETGIFVDFYANVDRVLLSETSPWFGERTREDLFREAFEAAAKEPPQRWGESNRVTLSHIMLGGKLPRFFGFDRGPVELRGGRATPHQGQVYRSAGRVTSFAPSMRVVADMSTDLWMTNLAGGPSDRRFSRWYCSDLNRWLAGEYKSLWA